MTSEKSRLVARRAGRESTKGARKKEIKRR
jgi:hypothetical protein